MRLLFFILLFPICVFSQGMFILSRPGVAPTPRDYYISASGTGDGLTSATPASIATLEAAITTGLNRGDEIYFNKGDSFYFGDLSLVIPDVPIAAYGTGANPILKGSIYVGGQTFTDNGDGTWYTTVSTPVKWLTEGDVMLRQGESDWMAIITNISAQVRQMNGGVMAAFTDLVGAKMIAKEFSYRVSETLTITNYNPVNAHLTFSGTLVGAAAGMPIKLFGQKQFMTLANDWFYDEATQRLYIKTTTNPQGRDLNVITKDYALEINTAEDITIDGVDFKHYFKYDLQVIHSPRFTAQNSSLSHGRGNAIRTYGNATVDMTLSNLQILNKGLRGVEVGAIQRANFTDITATNIGIQSNIGRPWDENKTGGTAICFMGDPTSNPIRVHNSIVVNRGNFSNLGYCGVQFWGANHQVKNSIVHDYCMKFSDGGGLYLYYATFLNASTSGCLFQNNLVYNGIGNSDGITSGGIHLVAGIYFDNGINGNTADLNVVYDAGDHAMFTNYNSTNHIITNNIFSSDNSCLVVRENAISVPTSPFITTTSCVATGNIFAAENSSARCITLSNPDGNNSFQPFATLNNNHYVNPYSVNITNRTSNNGSSYTDMALAAWKTYTAKEATGTARVNYKVTPDADDILIETNSTDSPVNFNTPVGYSDYNAAPFSNPVSIPARYGLIYFQD